MVDHPMFSRSKTIPTIDSSERFSWGVLEMDLSQHTFLVDGKEVTLTRNEY